MSGREVSSQCFTETIVEDAAIAWLEILSYAVLPGRDIEARESGASAFSF